MNIDDTPLLLTKIPIQKQLKAQSIICQQCSKMVSKYQCPQCKIHYCSLQCFRIHSENCVKEFDLRVEKDQYRGIKASFDEQSEMKKTLLKLYNEMKEETIIPQDEDEQIERLIELDQLADEGKLTIDNLNEVERAQLNEFAETFAAEPWKPWWETSEGIFSLYVDDGEQSKITNEFTEFRNTLKSKMSTIPSWNKLCKIQNEEQEFHLMNIVFSICIASRLVNGELIHLNAEFYNIFITLSSSMNLKAGRIGSMKASYVSICENARLLDISIDVSAFQKDLQQVYTNRFYIIETLFQAYDALHSLTTQEINIEDERKLKKFFKEVNARKSKLIFFISMAMVDKKYQIDLN